ncbi:MAG: NADH-quinone oxidoreductase subunit NuoF [Deltaproteobacteria bacterium]|nr:NADH-quinone oxidoreductase subunit NuoF [Deltaproteobacteria bacterium]
MSATKKPLTQHIRTDGEMIGFQEYIQLGGYQAVQKAKQMAPQDVTKLVSDSGLGGRGGAGFSTGFKMSAVPMGDDASKTKYLICNADEMEPGTFKDRLLLECHPHQLIEGMMISAHAIQATVAYIFVRGEYKLSIQRLEHAVQEAYAQGLLGQGLEMYVHASAGRYICGEETALLNALEGKRATPRAKPPFPQTVGLWGKPTLVNNVETLSCLPHIVNHGAEWFKSLSKTADAGTKLYGLSGHVNNPGLFELPMGTTARELIEVHAGGMKDGRKFRALLPGGASTDFWLEDKLDVPMDFSSTAKIRTRMGTGTIIILDDKTCPVGMLLSLERFFKQESCGWCTPCRDGLTWVEKILQAFENGEGREEDIEQLERHARLLGPGSTFCALAPGAASPLGTGMKYFKEEFLKHIDEKRCPYANHLH